MANPPLTGQSANFDVPGVSGTHAGGGRAVSGTANSPPGVPLTSGTGVFGSGAIGIQANGLNGHGLIAFSQGGDAVHAFVESGSSGSGVRGTGDSGSGVLGISASGVGVQGKLSNTNAIGNLGCADPQFHQHAGVYGESDQQGVMGLTTVAKGTGVYGGGTTAAGGDQIGVRGETRSRVGVQGTSFGEGIAIEGHSLSGDKGLAGRFVGNVHIQGNPGTSSGDLRVEGTSSFGGNATFQGNIDVAGDIRLLNADVAEEFSLSVAESVQPGTVMVIGEDGTLQSSTRAYDKCVAGVVSGGGALKPAIILDKRCEGDSRRVPIAMVGKVSCKVDAQYSPIQVGDLLTTSATPGHAMRASDPSMAFGSVIGKALARLEVGQGTIPILIALQ